MTVTGILTIFTVVVTAYFLAWNTSQFLMAAASWRFLLRYQRRRHARNLALPRQVATPPTVSIIAPAYNEALTIVESVRALLAVEYESREIIVVNDGSTDDTLARLQQAFALVPAPLAIDLPLATADIRGVYRSVIDTQLIVLDKVNGGSKADASNAGINAATGRLVLSIDADTILEPDALTRAVVPFMESADTIAVGGYVAIANGSTIVDNRVVAARVPDSWLARFQIIEYMRSFLMFRLWCAAQNGVVLISGAFGLFRRDAVLEVGGFDRESIGEDLDLTLRLQRHYRGAGRPARIAFVPLPVCWTQAPEDAASLKSQRCRWRRGLVESLWRHRAMIGNPRYGVVGMVVLPYMTIFEATGPLVETFGYLITTVAALLGLLNWSHYRVMLAASLLFGTATTLLGIYLSDVATRRYMGPWDLSKLLAASILENVGYRQLNSWWGIVGTVQALRGKQGWGNMNRKAF